MIFKNDFAPDSIVRKLPIIEISADISDLTDNDKIILNKLIDCAKLLDEIFLIQKYDKNLKLKEEIERTGDEKIINYFKIMAGPFNELSDRQSYIEGINPNDTGTFYESDITITEWDNYLEMNPIEKEDLISPYTVVVRDGKKLKAIKYCDFYKEYLKKAGDILTDVCNYTDNVTEKSYYAAQANAFYNNEFEEADIRWLQLSDNVIETLLGAYECYEDRFLGYKTSFTSCVGIINKEGFKKIDMIKKLLDILQQNLPIPDHYKKSKRGSISQIEVVNLIYAGGDSRYPIPTAAFNLPNSQKIRSEFGSKKILLYNIMEAKFKSVLKNLAYMILDENDLENVTFNAYFNFILMHEISHELGIGFVKDIEGVSYDVSYFLKDLYTIIEETKADVMGISLLNYLVKECYITDCTYIENCTTYLAGILRSIRFGTESVHGLSNIIQWNYLSREDVIIKSSDGKLTLDFHKFDKVISNLLTTVLTLQGEGDYENSKTFITEFSKIDDTLNKYINKLVNLPVDIMPYFPLADEKRPAIE